MLFTIEKKKKKKRIPLDMTELWMITSVEFPMWIPSVLGLFAGEFIDIESTVTCWQWSKRIWNCGLFMMFIPVSVKFFPSKNLIACGTINV